MAEQEKNVSSIGLMKIDFNAVVENERIPKYYGNSFSMGNSLTEATMIVQVGATPVAVVFMSFASLKTLHGVMGSVIANVEKGMGIQIEDVPTTQEKWNCFYHVG